MNKMGVRGVLVVVLLALVLECYSLRCPTEEDMSALDERFMMAQTKCSGAGGQTAGKMRARGEERKGDNARDSYGRREDNESSSTSDEMEPNPSHRHRRQSRGDNTGQRSQYNPNRGSGVDTEREARNKTTNRTGMDELRQAYCAWEHMDLIGEGGLPDKEKLARAFSLDSTDEEFQQLLKGHYDECYQLFYDGNDEKKLNFAMNLMTCVEMRNQSKCKEHGSANIKTHNIRNMKTSKHSIP